MGFDFLLPLSLRRFRGLRNGVQAQNRSDGKMNDLSGYPSISKTYLFFRRIRASGAVTGLPATQVHQASSIV
jgi:hypothetical protein